MLGNCARADVGIAPNLLAGESENAESSVHHFLLAAAILLDLSVARMKLTAVAFDKHPMSPRQPRETYGEIGAIPAVAKLRNDQHLVRRARRRFIIGAERRDEQFREGGQHVKQRRAERDLDGAFAVRREPLARLDKTLQAAKIDARAGKVEIGFDDCAFTDNRPAAGKLELIDQGVLDLSRLRR